MYIERKWSMPNKNTFNIKPIKELIKEEVTKGLWVDPFANNNEQLKETEDLKFITNDLNTEYDTDYHLDALEFLKQIKTASVEGVLFDPPYSPRQISECYKSIGIAIHQETTQSSFYSKIKKEIGRIVKPGGKVITFCWNSGGVGKKYGFEINRILLVAHGGWHNDTIVTVETKI